MEWISVDDRLPKLNDSCSSNILIYDADDESWTDGWICHSLNYGYQWASYAYPEGYDKGIITHWMPLPKPPTHKGK